MINKNSPYQYTADDVDRAFGKGFLAGKSQSYKCHLEDAKIQVKKDRLDTIKRLQEEHQAKQETLDRLIEYENFFY